MQMQLSSQDQKLDAIVASRSGSAYDALNRIRGLSQTGRDRVDSINGSHEVFADINAAGLRLVLDGASVMIEYGQDDHDRIIEAFARSLCAIRLAESNDTALESIFKMGKGGAYKLLVSIAESDFGEGNPTTIRVIKIKSPIHDIRLDELMHAGLRTTKTGMFYNKADHSRICAAYARVQPSTLAREKIDAFLARNNPVDMQRKAMIDRIGDACAAATGPRINIEIEPTWEEFFLDVIEKTGLDLVETRGPTLHKRTCTLAVKSA
jgi:hypothetical protein